MHTFNMPLGPTHPALEEAVFFCFKIDGEKVIDVNIKPGHAHRGIEALGMQRNPVQVIYLAERICGICSTAHNSTFCRAVEAAANLEVPERAQYIRTIASELERLHSHMLWFGLIAHEIGFHSLLHYVMKLREKVMDNIEYISGSRVHFGMCQIGGVRRDIPKEKHDKVTETVDYYKKAYEKLKGVFLNDKTIKLRMQNVGILTKEDAIRLCAVGPTARGSGINRDVRQDWTYLAYGDLGFKAKSPKEITGKIKGDIYDRTIVRILEIKQSAEIIEQCLDQMPSGKLLTIPKVAALLAKLKQIKGEGIGRQEAPRGDLHHYVRLDNNEKISTWKVKAPTYNNILSIKPMIVNAQIADIPAIISSIDPCIACMDRVTIIENNKSKTMTKHDLHKLSVEKTKKIGKIKCY